MFLRVKESLRESILNTKVHTKANYIHNFKKGSQISSCFICIWGLEGQIQLSGAVTKLCVGGGEGLFLEMDTQEQLGCSLWTQKG